MAAIGYIRGLEIWVVEIVSGDVVRYWGKAKYEDAGLLGVRPYTNGYFIDQIAASWPASP